MQRVQRQAGKFMKRSVDQADVATIMQEFVVADQLLDSFMDAVRSFQTAWRAILGGQLATASYLETIYRPIYDSESNFNTETEPAKLQKALELRSCYAELENDLQQETLWIQTKLLDPAMDAKQSIAPIKKMFNKRENCKLDFERYQSRADHARQKGARNPKEEAAIAKYESDLAQGQVLYKAADENIRRSIPPVIDAIQALIPPLMDTQIMLQHALVGQLYTVLHDYCQKSGIPSPAPPMEEVVAVWDREFTPFRQEVESGLRVLVTGKAIHQPMRIEEKPKSYTGLGLRSKVPGRSSSQQAVPQMSKPPAQAQIGYEEPEQEETPPPRPARPGQAPLSSRPRVPSSMSLQSHQSLPEEEEAPPPKPPRPGGASPMIPTSSKPRTSSSLSVPRSNSGTPLPGMSPSMGTALPGMTNPLSPGPSFANGSRRSSASTTYSNATDVQERPDYLGQHRNPSTASVASSIAGKKKPPPPPVKRRVTGQETYVVALYDFAGQGGDDLAFREGDRIKVLQKSESTDDWWKGELRGKSGSFPANYVEIR